MSVSSSTVIAIAERDVGVVESPMGSNRGKRIDEMARNWGAWMLGQPWCGSALYDWYKRAGFTSSTNPAHPSTQVMWDRARANGTLTSTPVPGCAIVWEGIHTGLVVAVSSDVVHTIEGNSGDRVRRRVRPRNGTHRYIVPKGLTQAAPRQTVYHLEDLKPNRRVVGPWNTRAKAERAYRGLKPSKQRVAEIKEAGGGKGFVIAIGEPRHYGPWVNKASRDNAQTVLERRLGRRLRRYSKSRPIPAGAISGTAESLGKTT